MIVTIVTDASWHHTYNKSGYAFYIESELGKTYRSGILKGEIQDCHEGEMKCIINSLVTLFASTNCKSISRIQIYSDSYSAIRYFSFKAKNRGKNKFKKYDSAVSAFTELKIKYNHIDIVFFHTKSHSTKSTIIDYVNDWCDKEATAALSKWVILKLQLDE